MDDKERQKKNIIGAEETASAAAAESEELPRFPHVALTEYLNRRNGGENAHAGHRGRLRESAKQDDDLSGLSDVELVELLLSFFIPQKDTNVIAHRLIDRFGSVIGVMSAPQEQLISVSHITAQIAAMLPALFTLCRMNGYKNLRLKNRAEAADFFGIAYLGKGSGTYIAFMDDDLNVRAIESFVCDGVPMREILSAACKYHCKYAFIARRETEMFPQTFNIAEEVGSLADMMSDMNVTMLDYLIFTDYGYYTIGTPKRERGRSPLYIFVPAVRFLRSPYMFEAVMTGGGALYAGRETAEPMEDFAAQLCRVIRN
ncbi:MAG: hypothetical protein K2L88_02815 [Clostridiales bacterium]|nr:hypothetical protein [Clostridiales bacterium]